MTELVRAIDANVILRYLLNDVPDQSRAALQLIESDIKLGITAVALAEAAWTLNSPRYRPDRETVVWMLSRLIARANVVPIGFDAQEMQAALAACTTQGADFGDALIAACARSYGVQEIYTFDRRFERAGMVRLQP